MANFSPSSGLWRHAWQKSTPDVPNITDGDYVDERFGPSEDLASEAPTIDTNNLSPGGQRAQGLPSKFEGTGTVNLDPEPEAFAYWLAQYQKAGATPVDVGTPATQAFEHKLAPHLTDVDFNLPRTMRLSRDDGRLETYINSRASALQLTVNIQATVTSQLSMAWERQTSYDFGAIIAGAPPPAEVPVLRNQPKFANMGNDTTTNRIFVRVATAATGLIEVKVGDASVYANTQTVVPGTWLTLQDESGVDIGEADSPVQLYVPSIAGWADLDEFHFYYTLPAPADVWAPNFPALSALNEIHVVISIGGSEVRMNTVQLNLGQDVVPNLNIGTRYADGLLIQGQRIVEGSFDRRYIDTSLRDRLAAGEPFALSVYMGSRVNIGTSATPYSLLFEAPSCLFNGRGAVITGPDDFPEPLNFDAYEDQSAGDPSDITVTATNSVSDMSV